MFLNYKNLWPRGLPPDPRTTARAARTPHDIWVEGWREDLDRSGLRDAERRERPTLSAIAVGGQRGRSPPPASLRGHASVAAGSPALACL